MVCRERFAAYSAEHGLRVGRVFIDDQVPDSTMTDRPGWTQLCYRLRQERAAGVLLMHARDLSADDGVAYRLAASVWDVGGWFFTVRGEAPTPDRPPTVELAL